MLGGAEILVVLVLALLLFGPDKLPGLARQVGRGMREIRRATTEVHRQFNLFTDEEPAPRPQTNTKVEPAEALDNTEETPTDESWDDWRYHEDETSPNPLHRSQTDDAPSTPTEAAVHELDLDGANVEVTTLNDVEELASPTNAVPRTRIPSFQPGEPVKQRLGEIDEPA